MSLCVTCHCGKKHLSPGLQAAKLYGLHIGNKRQFGNITSKPTVVGSQLGPVTFISSSLKTYFSYQVWIMSCGADLKFNQETGCLPHKNLATIAPVRMSYLAQYSAR